MPRQAAAPPHARIFGRVRTFDCECPGCATLILGRSKPKDSERHPRTRKRRVQYSYNPVTSLLRCPVCLRAWYVGLILWPAAKAHAKTRADVIPEDMRPTAAQLAILRQYVHGFAATAEKKRQGEPVNVAITAECTCSPGGWRMSCPVHGWEEVSRAEAQSTEEDT